MPTAKVVEEFIATFIDAWPTRDASALMDFFSEDATYHNIPLQAVHGKPAIAAALESFMKMGGTVEVDIANVVTEGNLVVVERVDHFIGLGTRNSLPVLGIFEVRDGLIRAWRDYFDLGEFRGT